MTMDADIQAICDNANALGSRTWHWVGDSLKWSPECGGCLMWTRNGIDWSSQDEGQFATPAEAEASLAWYEHRGVTVDWESLHNHAVVVREGRGL
jgi:hypothetical protein